MPGELDAVVHEGGPSPPLYALMFTPSDMQGTVTNSMVFPLAQALTLAKDSDNWSLWREHS